MKFLKSGNEFIVPPSSFVTSVHSFNITEKEINTCKNWELAILNSKVMSKFT